MGPPARPAASGSGGRRQRERATDDPRPAPRLSAQDAPASAPLRPPPPALSGTAQGGTHAARAAYRRAGADRARLEDTRDHADQAVGEQSNEDDPAEVLVGAKHRQAVLGIFDVEG